MNKVRTRFAPSPTGDMHIGNLRTSIYAFALAKHNKGDFILRIEDTDKKREKENGIEEIKNLLSMFSIKWDEYYVQSERLGIYKKAAEKLVKDGHAFYCQCEAKNAKYEGYSKLLHDPCRDKKLDNGAIKLRVPENETLKFSDFVLKEEVTFNSDIVFDATLLKSDGYPTYHLASVVDDHEMKISHVLRGHDWLPSTPIHILIYKYLDYDLPQIGHLTDILDPEGGKLSKRKGSTSVVGLLADGYLPRALLNFVILLGWAPKNNQEIFNIDSFVEAFDENGFQKSNPILNRDKLDWFNGFYIRQMSDDELSESISSFYFDKYAKEEISKITPLIKERISKLSDFEKLAEFFFESPSVDLELLSKNFQNHLQAAKEAFEKLDKFEPQSLGDTLVDYCDKGSFKRSDFFMDLRIAITGKKVSPPLNESICILGKKETLLRIEKVIN